MSIPTVHQVPDISCQHCVDAITREVTAVDGVTNVDVNLDAKTVAVVGGDNSAVLSAIDEAGYDVV